MISLSASTVSHTFTTTRKNTIGSVTEDKNQVVFVDTPGISMIKTLIKHNISTDILHEPTRAIGHCDMIMCVVDGSHRKHSHYLHDYVYGCLKDYTDKETILVLNKVDLIKCQDHIIEKLFSLTNGVVNGRCVIHPQNHFTNRLSGRIGPDTTTNGSTPNLKPFHSKNEHAFENFKHVFVVSALKGTGMNDLRNYLLQKCQKKHWVYDKNFVTKFTSEELAHTCVMENLLDYFPPNIVYESHIVCKEYEKVGGVRSFSIDVFVKHFYRRNYIHPNNHNYIKEIAYSFNRKMSEMLQTNITCTIIFKDKEFMDANTKDLF